MESLKEVAVDAILLMLAWAVVTAGSMFASPPVAEGLHCDQATISGP